MFKHIFIFIVIVVSAAFGSAAMKIIPPEEAFSVHFAQKDDFLYVTIEMKEGVYLLHDKVVFETITPKKINFTDAVDTPAAKVYKDQRVHFDFYEAVIPLEYFGSKKIYGKTTLNVTYQGCAAEGIICYPPMNKIYEIDIKKGSNSLSEQNEIANMFADKSFLFIIASFFGFGLLLSLTPCTLPMLPIISSIIANQSKTSMNVKKGFLLSFIYVFFMSIAYAIAGVIAGLFGANVQAAMQNPWIIGIFCAIFLFLALCMFNLFSLELPSFLKTKLSSYGKDKNGLIGVAIMGFLSALIVGPCVAAPLMGALIYIGQSGDALLGACALFVMSMGMGIPLLAIGIGAGKFLPKPGIWMEKIQKVFGFVMLGVAAWMGSRILPPNISLILYAILIASFGIYIFFSFTFIWKNLFRFFALLISLYGIVLLSGGIMGGDSLLNPMSNFKENSGRKALPDYIYIKNLKDLYRQIEDTKKPVMVEFTASWCIICTEFEEKTLIKESVKKRLEEFLLLKIDVTKNSNDDKELMRRFGLYGPPAIVFFKDKNELENLRIVGFKNEEEFLAHLDMVENE